jgi:hypothetical protein
MLVLNQLSHYHNRNSFVSNKKSICQNVKVLQNTKKNYYQKLSAIFVILITFLDTKAILTFASHNKNGG